MAFSSITPVCSPVDSDEEINCSFCIQPYRDPRLLPCLHTFCFDCLQKQLDDSTDQQAALLCPTCFEEIPLPISDLPIHVYLRNQANTVRRVLRLENVRIVIAKRRRARSVPIVATAGFESASSAYNSTKSSRATRSTRSLV